MKKFVDDISSFIEKMLKEWQIKGVSVAIVKDDKMIFSKGFGYRNEARGLKVTEETMFPIGSITKSFTSAGISILVDEGRLDIDKPVRYYYPGFKLYDKYATEYATIRDLLCHRVGLPRHDIQLDMACFTRQEMLERLPYLEPTKNFRSYYQYQNHMYIVAGHIIEIITGQSWEEFTQKRIADILEMKDTNFSTDEMEELDNYAIPYTIINDEVVEIPFANVDLGSCGAINSTIKDMVKWLSLQLNKGKENGVQLISQTSILDMHTPQVVINNPPYIFDESPYQMYGLGWHIECYRGHRLISHGGCIDGFGSLMAFMPDDNVGIVILTNGDYAALFNNAIFRSIFDGLLKLSFIDWNKRYKKIQEKNKTEIAEKEERIQKGRKEYTKMSHNIEEYTGIFENKGYGKVFVSMEDGQLYIKYNNYKCALNHYHYNIFQFRINQLDMPTHPILVTYSLNKEGDIVSLEIPFEVTGKDIVFTKIK